MTGHISRKTQFHITAAVLERCIQDDDGFAIYDEGQSDQSIAAEVGGKFGEEVAREQVSVIRRDWFGKFRTLADGIPEAAPATKYDARIEAVEVDLVKMCGALATVVESQQMFNEMIENFRAVMAGHGQKIEAIRKVVETTGIKQVEAIYRAKDRLEVLLAEGPAGRDDLFRLMRGEGFPEGVTQSALVLLGAVMCDDLVTGPDAPAPVEKATQLADAEPDEPDREDRYQIDNQDGLQRIDQNTAVVIEDAGDAA